MGARFKWIHIIFSSLTIEMMYRSVQNVYLILQMSQFMRFCYLSHICKGIIYASILSYLVGFCLNFYLCPDFALGNSKGSGETALGACSSEYS